MDHEQRQILAGEAHARPTIPVACPAVVLHEARLHDDGGTAARAYAEDIARAVGGPPPRREADHMLVEAEGGLLKWERHGEFCTWTWVRPGAVDAAGPIAPPAAFAGAPGRRFAAAAVFVGDAEPTPEQLDAALGPESPENERAASLISSDRCGVWTGFRLGADGWTRFVLHDRGLGRFRAGRVVRRLLEVETYRIAALLAFPIAKEARRRIDALERKVGAAIADDSEDEAAILRQLIDSAREVEQIAQETAFRFGAAKAYRTIVATRIAEFRETRIEGWQRLEAFLERRFAPAMDTCASTAERLETLAKRVERASGLLRTRIDLEMQQQNQRLLASMNETARTQVRLQKAVEGFSVAAISYYAFMLLSKVLHPLAAAAGLPHGPAFDAALVIGVVALVWGGLTLLRRRLGS